MRLKSDPQRYFHWSTASTSKIVREYEEKYNRISEILDENPEILDLAAADLRKLSTGSRKGREATYTAENLLRAVIVRQIEGTAFRGTMIQLAHNPFLQDFLRLGTRAVMDYSLINRAFCAISPRTWEKINARLTAYALEEERISPETLRVDTTVVESNIHWPTDTSLLWDSFRKLHLLLRRACEISPGIIDNRFHVSKVKKLHLYITRYSASKNKKRQRQVQKSQRKLLEQVERIYRIAEDFCEIAAEWPSLSILQIAWEIESYLPKIRQVIAVGRRAWLEGEVVPAKDRIFSIFEDHTELIKRGRRGKPVEFGHMVLLGQTKERFITQYDVMREKIPDCQLPETILERHEESFGELPEKLVADKGFCGNPEAMNALRAKVKVVAIPQRLKDFTDDAFVALQHFRAGIEGSISVLKRAYGLLRSQYRGFRNFVSHVAAGVFCHNLVLLTGPPGS
jgi:IS5 family transposase